MSICQVQGNCAASFQINGYVQRTVFILAIQIWSEANILDVFLVTCVKIAVTSYARVAEEVLIFQITAVAPAEYLEGNHVFTRFQVVGQVELGFQFAVFAISYVTSVHPKVHVGSYRAEMRKNLFAFPVGGKDDFFPVRAYVIVFCRHLRRIVFELASPGISYVDIDRVTVTVQLPNARHLKVIPTFVVEISLIKVGRSCICMSYPVEFPRTVQGHEIR